MATTIETPPTITGPEVVIPTAERMRISSPIGWSSIFGASAVALGVWLLLHLFGIGVGLTSLDPGDNNSLRGIGIGIGVWSLIAPIIALFIGGLVVGRVAPTINRLNAAIHGAVTWAVATVTTFVVLAWMLTALVGRVAAAGSAVASTVPGAIQGIGGQASGMSIGDLGIRPQDLVAPINDWLASQNLPPVTANELEAIGRDTLRTAVRGGDLDRQKLVAIVAEHTQLSQDDAGRVADQLEARWGDLTQQAQQLASGVRTTAVSAADAAGNMLLWMTLSMLLSLAAAVGGAMITVARERKAHVRTPSSPVRAPVAAE